MSAIGRMRPSNRFINYQGFLNSGVKTPPHLKEIVLIMKNLEEIKEKMRKLLEEAEHNEDKEPQTIGNPERIFDKEENESEDGYPAFTDK